MSTELSLTRILKAQSNVLVALMLRDVRTRFGSAPGFLLAVVWPLSHILILVMLNSFLGRITPYGDSSALWFATSIMPFMVFSYMARFIMIGIVINRPLLAFPAIKILDILFSRAIIEILIAALVIIVLAVILWAADINFMPHSPQQAFFALGAAIALGIGFGVLNAIIAMIFVQWITIFTLFTIILWMTSGVFFVPSHMPEYFRVLLFFNPAIHCTEWMRSAYFESYQSQILSEAYLLAIAFGSIFLGLVLERVLRGRLLIG